MDIRPLPVLPFPGIYPGSERRPLAMAFITPQRQITEVFTTDEGLRSGTVFPELYKPFSGKRGEF